MPRSLASRYTTLEIRGCLAILWGGRRITLMNATLRDIYPTPLHLIEIRRDIVLLTDLVFGARCIYRICVRTSLDSWRSARYIKEWATTSFLLFVAPFKQNLLHLKVPRIQSHYAFHSTSHGIRRHLRLLGHGTRRQVLLPWAQDWRMLQISQREWRGSRLSVLPLLLIILIPCQKHWLLQASKQDNLNEESTSRMTKIDLSAKVSMIRVRSVASTRNMM